MSEVDWYAQPEWRKRPTMEIALALANAGVAILNAHLGNAWEAMIGGAFVGYLFCDLRNFREGIKLSSRGIASAMREPTP